MQHPSLKLGALAGIITAFPVMALLYLGQAYAGLPFVPFDLFHPNQHGTHCSAVAVLSGPGAPIFARQQGDRIIVRMGQHTQAVGAHAAGGAHLIGIDLPKGLDDDLVAVLQGVQVHKGTGVVLRIPDVGGDGGVAGPGGEGGAFEIASLIAQPGYVPATRACYTVPLLLCIWR